MFPSFPIQALTFDVFGTVVDVRTSLTAELSQFGSEKGISCPWPKFATDWINAYAIAVEQIKNADADSAFKNADQLIREGLLEVVQDYQIRQLTDAEIEELSQAWRRLKPWPDSLSGMQRLRTRFRLVALANGNVSLLADIAYHAGMPWYMIISAEEVKRFKPNPVVYQHAIQRLGLRPAEMMMVASHRFDLDGAANAGMKTAFVNRPEEPSGTGEHDPNVTATDFNDLADQLGV